MPFISLTLNLELAAKNSNNNLNIEKNSFFKDVLEILKIQTYTPTVIILIDV